MKISYSDVKKLEGLRFSMNEAVKRKRKGLYLHVDELPRMVEALDAALAVLAAVEQPSMTQRMMQAEASERAERGEPYDERQGG